MTAQKNYSPVMLGVKGRRLYLIHYFVSRIFHGNRPTVAQEMPSAFKNIQTMTDKCHYMAASLAAVVISPKDMNNCVFCELCGRIQCMESLNR